MESIIKKWPYTIQKPIAYYIWPMACLTNQCFFKTMYNFNENKNMGKMKNHKEFHMYAKFNVYYERLKREHSEKFFIT